MALKTLKVIYTNPDTGKISFGFNSGATSIGISQNRDSIIQRFIVKLFTYLGSNASQPNSGSQFFRFVGANYIKKDQDIMRTNINLAMEEVVNQMINDQDLSLEPDLLLAGFDILSIIYDNADRGWQIRIKINFESGAGTLLTI